eukprot:TRINITY_DN33236_c0_g2_i1.p1 TRINITY_DN33236_c0_g2~~TRINITY_DN33236_c0_g2_i1.p1  ORF type:complete len:562 (-),score=21.31 TRINITY_DN33236_c0_g2_i1:83-1768(-)
MSLDEDRDRSRSPKAKYIRSTTHDAATASSFVALRFTSGEMVCQVRVAATTIVADLRCAAERVISKTRPLTSFEVRLLHGANHLAESDLVESIDLSSIAYITVVVIGHVLKALVTSSSGVNIYDVENGTRERTITDLCLNLNRWCYRPHHRRRLYIRVGPNIGGPRTRQLLNPGDMFEAAEERLVGNITYLKLANNSGWVFDKNHAGEPLCHQQFNPRPRVSMAMFSQDGSDIVVQTEDFAMVFDSASGERKRTFGAPVGNVSFRTTVLPMGNCVLVAEENMHFPTVSVFDVETGAKSASFELNIDFLGVLGEFVISPDSKWILVVWSHGWQIFDLLTGSSRYELVHRRDGVWSTATIAPHGKYFILISPLGYVEFIDVASGKPLSQDLVIVDKSGTDAHFRFSPNGELYFVSPMASTVSIHTSGALQTWRSTGIVKAYESETHTCLKAFASPSGLSVTYFRLSPDGQRLWLASFNGPLLCFNVSSGEIEMSIPLQDGYSVKDCVLARDSDKMLLLCNRYGSYRETAKVYSLTNKEVQVELEYEPQVIPRTVASMCWTRSY